MRHHPAELPRPPSERVLRELPARVVVFLRAVGGHAPIRAAMESGGYGPEDHDEGLCLLLTVCAYGTSGLDPQVDAPAREATREIVDWARTNWARLRAALARLHPAAAPLFRKLNPNDEARVVLAVAALLERLATLEAETHGRCVLDTLAHRGFDATERARLAKLVATAQRAEAPAGTVLPRRNAAPDEALLALRRWFHDWSTTAKVVIKRKDWLIRLGLVRRRRTRESGGENE